MLSEGRLRLQQLPEHARLTPAAFAIKAGTTLPYLWRVKTGRVNLNLRSISHISVALGVPVSDILAGIEADVAATVGPGKGMKAEWRT